MKPDLHEAGAYRPVLRDGARWVLEKRLGCGGTSVVWQARDPKTGDRVALKVLEGPSAESLAQRSFGKEVAMATRLDHPGILRVFGMSCDDAGRPLVEMELAEGGSLATKALRQGGCLSWEELRPLALQLCDALSHAHGLGVIHRDIKPANLLLDGSGLLKLADFGCAALGEGARVETSATVTLVSQGTLAYMSPQQLNGGKPAAADDIYSAAATLYALLAGRPPFHTGYLAHQILTVRPPSIDCQQRELGLTNPVPPAVARAIAAALEKNPARRPASAEEFRRQLEGGCAPVWRRRQVLALIGGGGVAAAVGMATLVKSKRDDSGLASAPDDSAAPPLLGPDKELLTGVTMPDGFLWIGGHFTEISDMRRRGLARLDANRSLDPLFHPGGGGVIRAIAAMEDGSVLVGGDLDWETQKVAGNLARLEADGRLDERFRSGCDWTVLCLAPDSRGGVLVGGLFEEFGGLKRQRIARLGPDLLPDPEFNPGADGNVYSLIPLADGGLYAGGRFRTIGGAPAAYLAKLQPDGGLDVSFPIAVDGEVSVLCLDRDGWLLVGGLFRKVNGELRPSFFRLGRDGSLDLGYNPLLGGNVLTIIPLHDGSVLIGGEFGIRGMAGPVCLAKVSAGGVVEPISIPRPEGTVLGLVAGGKGHLLAGGKFVLGDGSGPGNAVWVDLPQAGGLELNRVAGHALWQIPASGPLLHAVEMAWSSDGREGWSALPAPSWTPEGWMADATGLPAGAVVRARGRLCGGVHNGSSSLFEVRSTGP